MAEAGGDVLPTRAPQQADQGVPHGGQRLRGTPHMHLARIFPQRHVPHIVPPVLDRPMAPPQCRQLL
jgi:hypothetical protein